MRTKKTEPKHNYLNLDGAVNATSNATDYELYLCVLNMGGGVRRPFYAEFVTALGDPAGPMARYVMRVTPRARGFTNSPVQSVAMDYGDYVVYAQEVVSIVGFVKPR